MRSKIRQFRDDELDITY